MNSHFQPDIAKEISCRITRTLLHYVREQNSGDLKGFLNGSPLDEAYLIDTNNWVSHAYLQWLYARMIEHLSDDNAVYHMTLASGRLQSLGILDRIVRLLGSPRLIYGQAPKYNQFLKMNGSVYIHDIGASWVLLEDRYHDSTQKTRLDCDYTRGILAGIPTMFGLDEAEVEELECQVAHEKYGTRSWPDSPEQGCGGCLYRVRWHPKRQPILKRVFSGRSVHRQAVEDLVQANRLIQTKYDEVKRLAADLDRTNRQLRQSKLALEAQAAKLTESERNYRILAENLSDMIWVLELSDLRFSYISPSVEKQRGFTPQEAMALRLDETMSPESLAQVTAILEEELTRDQDPAVDPDRSRRLEIEQTIKGGGYRWAESTVSFVRDDNGRPSAVLGVTRDITERKVAEAALRTSEEKYHQLVENAADAIFLTDAGGRILEVNRKACESLGYSRPALLARNMRHIDPIFDSEQAMNSGLAQLQPGQPVAIETTHRRSDGSYFPVQLRLGSVRLGADKSILILAHDITERKLMEKELRESEARYRLLVQHAPAGIFEIDLKQMRFISVNEVMCQYTGYTAAEFREMDPQSLLTQDSLDIYLRRLGEIRPDDPDLPSAEYRIKTKDGRRLWVLVNSRFVFEGDVPVKATAVVYDRTDVREAEAEKKRLEAKLIEVQRIESLGTLAGGIAHDFNNLMMAIQGNTSLMLVDEDRSSEDQERLRSIEGILQRGVGLTRQLLGLARGGKYEVKPTDLNRLVVDSATMFSRTRREIRIHHQQQAGLWTVECDQSQMDQVLLNIFINAWQAMPDGGELFVSTENTVLDPEVVSPHSVAPGRYVKIAISDTGTGMDDATAAKIFDPFFTTKGLGRGTGLGLASAYGIVKNHDGIIEVFSQPGNGSTFNVYLPAIEKAAASGAVSVNLLHGKGRILLVDDEPLLLDIGREMLETLGYSVEAAASGAAALDIFQRVHAAVDLVVLDMVMPGMSGAQTLVQLKAIDPELRVLLSSGYSFDDQAAEMLADGCRGFIEKPFKLEALSKKIREIME